MIEPKPWWSARWETIEPEEPTDGKCEPEEPTDGEILDYEESYGLYR